ncbi:hypothetical protein NW762_003117 [Fusarium torreyae]|uniref:P-type Na(+) transporter n=1 Tax=Fusarium torreyae TaxID=1237075 RepID=A0A9W8VLB8_9HYPO|nr:hypothetical protein NW762_003117 [Fusarium torreyae]
MGKRKVNAHVLGQHISGQSNKPLSQPPHSLTSQQVLQELHSDATTGLSLEEIPRRLEEMGPNELEQKAGVQPVKIFLEQVFNAMTLVLLMALAASFSIQAWIPGGILAGIIILNIFIGFFQSLQAEKTIDSLRNLGGKTLAIQTAELVPGDIIDLATGDSVPADIRLIEAVNLEADEALLTGESVPILKIPKLAFDSDTGPGDRLNVVYSSSTITKGRGRGVVFATGMFTEIGLIAGALSGSDDELKGHQTQGKRSLIHVVWDPIGHWLGKFLGLTVGTPLQKKLSQPFISLFCFAVVCAIIVMGANNFDSNKDVIIYAITTAIGTIPVSLLLVLTPTMAAGTKKMLERNVVVRNLSSLEALGGVTNICSDKTGTITQGRMVTRKAWIPGCGTYSVESTSDVYNPTAGQIFLPTSQPKDLAGSDTQKEKQGTLISPTEELASKSSLQWYLKIASLANLASVEQSDDNSANPGEWKAKGAPTEVAIEVFAGRFGWNRLSLSQGEKAEWKHVAEYPFDSDVKKMTVIFHHLQSDKTHIFTKGAVERVVASCKSVAIGDEVTPLTSAINQDIHLNMEALASQGLRVLALAHKVNDRIVNESEFVDEVVPNRQTFERDLTFRGLIGIYDPPRLESLPSVRACQGAGIAVHMLTGDHPQTARAIAVDVGILPSPAKERLLPADMSETLMMAAHEFDALTDGEIDGLAQLPLVLARCAPSTKVRMIEALHRRGRYVAMTGDGVKDSPSLKRADIGIAMGTGSDVAKESSDIILTDDNFTSILSAVEEGRRIFDNIQKFILHVLAANIGFVITLLAGLAFKDDNGVSVYQLTPVEIIWMLMGTGAFCETGLGFEKAVTDILDRPPQNLKYGMFTPEFLVDMVFYGIIMAACVLGSFTVVIFGFSDGELGSNCNNEYSEGCDVFRARATCFTTMTWIFLLFAWGLIDFRRSLFYMPRGFKAWVGHLWGNQFLFWAVFGVFFTVFPVLYIPKLNHIVFQHTGISWEWAVVFIDVSVFMILSEAWKWAKRIYFQRRSVEQGGEFHGELTAEV